MSYEREMLDKFKMPPRHKVEDALLKALFSHNGTIKEFGSDEDIVEEIANEFNLNNEQRTVSLETLYRKENRVKKSNLWHRLLFRAADSLSKQKLISRPTQTVRVTNKKEWMLTEEGFDKALIIGKIPSAEKVKLSIKSYEVEKLVTKLKVAEKPKNYSPFNIKQQKKQITKTQSIRARSFRHAVIEVYDYKCSVCGLKIYSPKNHQWEVEAAHIIPHGWNGKDDVWNGISLCRFHHWAFDVGWFSFDSELHVIASKQLSELPSDMGKIWNFDTVNQLLRNDLKIQLPRNVVSWPDLKAIQWHRENILQKPV